MTFTNALNCCIITVGDNNFAVPGSKYPAHAVLDQLIIVDDDNEFAFERPNELISMFPLVLIPTFLVPLAILLHIISLIQLGRATAHVGGSRERVIGHVQV